MLQMVLELGHRDLIHARGTLVLDHPLIRKLQVAAFHYGFHQPARLRFRPPAGRRVRLGTHASSGRIPSSLAHVSLISSMRFRLHRPSRVTRRLLAALPVRPFGVATYYGPC